MQENKDNLPEFEFLSDGWKFLEEHPAIKGWEAPSILELNLKKFELFKKFLEGSDPLGISHESDLSTNTNVSFHNINMSYAYAFSLAGRMKEKISMLDFGGGIGHYYFLSKSLIPELELEYNCRDLPHYCRQGRILIPKGNFFEDDSCFNRSFDFIHAGSSIQYMKNWKTTLENLSASTAGYLYITRSSFVNSVNSFTIIHRPYRYGYNTEYISWCINKNDFIQTAEAKGLKLTREFVIEKAPEIVNAPEKCEIKGFLFKRVN